MNLPAEIQEHAGLPCCHAWRSIGTHIWFEFGVPKTRVLKNGRRSISGDMTLHVSSYNWQLYLDGRASLNADTVDDLNFAALVKPWFQNGLFPNFVELDSQVLKLEFSDATILQISQIDAEDTDDEIEVMLPDGKWWGFRFGKGWSKSEASKSSS
ncbi:MAG: hypothetical protein ABJG15_11795 [Hyphomonadaceae bacterium]